MCSIGNDLVSKLLDRCDNVDVRTLDPDRDFFHTATAEEVKKVKEEGREVGIFENDEFDK